MVIKERGVVLVEPEAWRNNIHYIYYMLFPVWSRSQKGPEESMDVVCSLVEDIAPCVHNEYSEIFQMYISKLFFGWTSDWAQACRAATRNKYLWQIEEDRGDLIKHHTVLICQIQLTSPANVFKFEIVPPAIPTVPRSAKIWSLKLVKHEGSLRRAEA